MTKYGLQVDAPFEALFLVMEFRQTPTVFLLGHAQTHTSNAVATPGSNSGAIVVIVVVFVVFVNVTIATLHR